MVQNGWQSPPTTSEPAASWDGLSPPWELPRPRAPLAGDAQPLRLRRWPAVLSAVLIGLWVTTALVPPDHYGPDCGGRPTIAVAFGGSTADADFAGWCESVAQSYLWFQTVTMLIAPAVILGWWWRGYRRARRSPMSVGPGLLDRDGPRLWPLIVGGLLVLLAVTWSFAPVDEDYEYSCDVRPLIALAVGLEDAAPAVCRALARDEMTGVPLWSLLMGLPLLVWGERGRRRAATPGRRAGGHALLDSGGRAVRGDSGDGEVSDEGPPLTASGRMLARAPTQSLGPVSPVPWADGSPLAPAGDHARLPRAHRNAAAAHAVPAEARMPPPALHDPATQEALSRYRSRSSTLLLLVPAMLSVAAASLAAFSFIAANDVVGGLAVGVAVVCFVAGIVGLARGRKMRSLLSKHAWELVPARVGYGISGRSVVLLPPTSSTGATGAPSEAFIVWASRQRFADLVGHDDVLVAGRKPGRAFVVSPPGEPQLMIARRALLPFMAKAQASTFSEGMPPSCPM
jgi:hypothetical protein